MFYWKKVDKDGKTTTVESCSNWHEKSTAIEIDEAEFNSFIASLPVSIPAPPPRNIEKELDDLKVQLKAKGVLS